MLTDGCWGGGDPRVSRLVFRKAGAVNEDQDTPEKMVGRAKAFMTDYMEDLAVAWMQERQYILDHMQYQDPQMVGQLLLLLESTFKTGWHSAVSHTIDKLVGAPPE